MLGEGELFLFRGRSRGSVSLGAVIWGNQGKSGIGVCGKLQGRRKELLGFVGVCHQKKLNLSLHTFRTSIYVA